MAVHWGVKGAVGHGALESAVDCSELYGMRGVQRWSGPARISGSW